MSNLSTFYRQRRLARIEEELADLQHDMIRDTQHCTICGSFRAGNLDEQEARRGIEVILKIIRHWQQQSWTRE